MPYFKVLFVLLALLAYATANDHEEEDLGATWGRHTLTIDYFKCPKKCEKSKCCTCNKFGETFAQVGKKCKTKAGEVGECAGKYTCEPVDPCEGVDCGSCGECTVGKEDSANCVEVFGVCSKEEACVFFEARGRFKCKPCAEFPDAEVCQIPE